MKVGSKEGRNEEEERKKEEQRGRGISNVRQY